jgi:ribosome-binding factor A
VREEIALIVRELKDPHVGFITVTRVEMSEDYQVVRVFVGVLGAPKERARSMSALRKATGFVRRELGRRVSVRHTPLVTFQYDEGLDHSIRVSQLLDEVHQAPLSQPDAEPEPAPEPSSDGGEQSHGDDQEDE